MNKEKYLAKIKKLLNLARKTTSAGEAAAALRQAQNLMRKHGVSAADAAFIDINEATTKGAPSDAVKIPKYMGFLVEVVCLSFGVKAYYTWRTSGFLGNEKRVVVFYGPDTRPQVAAYAFDVLSRQMVKARREYTGSMRSNIKPATKVARGDVFCENWAQGAYQVLEEFNVSEPETTLMVAYREKLARETGLKTGELREANKARGTDAAADAGYRSGLNAQISHGVTGSSSTPLALPGGAA